MKYVGHVPKPLRVIEDFIDAQQLPFNWRLALICWPLAIVLVIFIII